MQKVLSTNGNGANATRLMQQGVALIKERAWSTLPGSKPHLDGRVILPVGRTRRMADLAADVATINAAGSDVVIWVPRGAGPIARASGGFYNDLRWGYTVHVLDGQLIALQRVVFLDTKARKLATAPGLLITVPEYHASSWNGLVAEPVLPFLN